MRVQVLYFAMLRDRKGRDSEQVEVAPGTTAEELYLQLFPPEPGGVLPVAFAVGQEYVAGSTRLKDGDEVAFIPPVGGG